MRMTASWSRSDADLPNTRVWRDLPRPMAGSPRIVRHERQIGANLWIGCPTTTPRGESAARNTHALTTSAPYKPAPRRRGRITASPPAPGGRRGRLADRPVLDQRCLRLRTCVELARHPRPRPPRCRQPRRDPRRHAGRPLRLRERAALERHRPRPAARVLVHVAGLPPQQRTMAELRAMLTAPEDQFAETRSFSTSSASSAVLTLSSTA